MTLSQPLTLPCGAQLPNRLAKAAMTEGLADARGLPTPELERLYGVWSDGGCGMLLSGNVQIDRDHLERPGNVILDRELNAEEKAAFQRWTAAGTRGGNHFWAQISHAGRQTFAMINPHPKAPSAVKLGLPGGQFGEPVALEDAEIEDIVERFARAVRICREVGFTGVQIHAAHGYLISQFLSPRSNRRTDRWGGSLENRARLLLTVIERSRAAVGPAFPISVKLNSADFQKGGFAFEDSVSVVGWLQERGVDLIEISGGTYEQPKLLGIEGMEPAEDPGVAASTVAREAYFVDFAKAMKDAVDAPLMVTGGFRSRAAMEQAVSSGAADVIGLGRPLCVAPDGARRILEGADRLPSAEKNLSLLPGALRFLEGIKTVRAMAGFATQFWFYMQIYALGRTGVTDPQLSVFKAWRSVEKEHAQRLKAMRAA
ncbi:MAG: NADH:flavin oxidoreductase/NADH oxidase family protein [Erythrobacter sp.]|uniref:NADH:flavin oxidoreductase/NADH oxidase family protein n=1 Tax=Erythrobacter sp. TaxID=1042 RepID=UPI0026080384|nr:NADH:flavin oxidoreductase/NADH oxidase family protein [Erythrobacter sp.]MDJ0976969.1 NADH:flavin oxidoreductase/NADH oxidase family protein [Erythrobacter sp.]